MKISRHENESAEDYAKRLELIIEHLDYDPDDYVEPNKDADHTDTWMHPERSAGWIYKKPENKMEFLIERQHAVPVTGNVAHIYEWRYWAKFDTKEERDAEYRNIKAQHPVWSIRKRDRNPYLDRLRVIAR